jgi:polyketide synthase PksR
VNYYTTLLGCGSINFLEVGAGMGGTTKALLNTFQDHISTYEFTDISYSFLNKAKSYFSTCKNMSFSVFDLNIESDLQLSTKETYNIIFSTNAIHTAKNVVNALKRLKFLLKPEGVLIISEIIKPRLWMDITFGLMKSWWDYKINTNRDHMLLSLSQWESALRLAELDYCIINLGENSEGVVIIAGSKSGLFDLHSDTTVLFGNIFSSFNLDNENVQEKYNIPTEYEDIKRIISEIISDIVEYPIKKEQESVMFSDLGIDSLMIIDIIHKINIDLRLNLHYADLMKNNTISSLSLFSLDSIKNNPHEKLRSSNEYTTSM